MAMYRVVIEKAKEEAQTFITACDRALQRLDEERERHRPYDYDTKTYGPAPDASPTDKSWGSAETGALRRKSMDLTRMLADLRRGY